MNCHTSGHEISIRTGTEDDLQTMLSLFKETISSVCRKDYTDEQLEAWKSGAENKERWYEVIRNQLVLIAESEHQIVGFCTLDNGGYIDLLFVHHQYQHKGIASMLYTRIEEEALRQHEQQLTADVSKTARPFFEKEGFHVLNEQNVSVQGIMLTNYKMVKNLEP